MGVGAALQGVSTVGNLVGGGKASSQQNQDQQQALKQQQEAMTMIQNFVSSASPVISNVVSQLANWSGLKPAELTALTANAAASGNSDIQTAQSRGAFGANQNAATMNALTQNQQTSELAASNVGAAAASQELGALEAIPSAENVLNPANAGANTLAGLSGQNSNSAAGIGNPWAPASSSLGSLASTITNGKGNSTSYGSPLGAGAVNTYYNNQNPDTYNTGSGAG